MVVRAQDYPPLLDWYGHVGDCSQCARATLRYEFDRRSLCSAGYELREKAREKTRWTPRMY